MDPEKAHGMAHLAVKMGLGKAIEASQERVSKEIKKGSLKAKVGNLSFQHPVGLAAGFDKNADFLPYLPELGFAFVEVGTVTPRAQIGNPKPRLHRLPQEESLFNRMGFNNAGAIDIAIKVKKAKEELPPGFRVGVNVGKNKDTPLEKAATDYRLALAPFADLVDFAVVNVSSPNTPGLRSLQNASFLRQVAHELNEEMSSWSRAIPIFLKLAPEVLGVSLSSLIEIENELSADAWVLTNTLAGEHKGQSGGLSGKILTTRSREVLSEGLSISKKPIVSVGGIHSPEEAFERLRMGAQLIEIYSGWIYGGPSFCYKILEYLLQNQAQLRFKNSNSSESLFEGLE